MSTSSPTPPPESTHEQSTNGKSDDNRSGTEWPLSQLGKAAGVAAGVLAILLGVLVLTWPGVTLLVIAILFGLHLILFGVLRIVLGVLAPADAASWVKPVQIILGVLTVIAGIICFLRPGSSLVVLGIILAAGWIAEGIGNVAHSTGSGQPRAARVLLGINGVVSIVAGVLVAIFPGPSLVLLTLVAGVALITIGVVQVVSALATNRAATARAPSQG